jgi:hypothetical protein
MELVLLVLLVLLLVIFLNWLNNLTTPGDNREPYLRDESGKVWALYVAGPVGDVPNHEAYIHDGTPHQNPAVNTYIGVHWFLIIPFSEEREERWYPITNNGVMFNLEAIQQRISQARLRCGQAIELVTMSRWAERQAIHRENGEQLQRGVPSGKLRKRSA